MLRRGEYCCRSWHREPYHTKLEDHSVLADFAERENSSLAHGATAEAASSAATPSPSNRRGSHGRRCCHRGHRPPRTADDGPRRCQMTFPQRDQSGTLSQSRAVTCFSAMPACVMRTERHVSTSEVAGSHGLRGSAERSARPSVCWFG